MSTSAVVLSDRLGSCVEEWAPAPAQPAKYAGIARNHRPMFDDYSVAKAHIMQAIGSGLEDMELWGDRVLLAVHCKPNLTQIKKADGTLGMVIETLKGIKEDWWQSKACLILKIGPDAWANGDDGYYKAMFGKAGRPKFGDWVFANASAGIQISLMGDGASRPQAKDAFDKEMDLYEWDGWPCRVVNASEIFGRLANPYVAV